MIVQVLSDTGPVRDHRDVVLLKQGGGPDAGDLQELRRLEDTAGDDDFAGGVQGVRSVAGRDLDACRLFVVVEADALGEGAVEHGQVAPLKVRAQVCPVGRSPEAGRAVDGVGLEGRTVQGPVDEAVGPLDADTFQGDCQPRSPTVGVGRIRHVQWTSLGNRLSIVGGCGVGNPGVRRRREVHGLPIIPGHGVVRVGLVPHIIGPSLERTPAGICPSHSIQVGTTTELAECQGLLSCLPKNCQGITYNLSARIAENLTVDALIEMVSSRPRVGEKGRLVDRQALRIAEL